VTEVPTSQGLPTAMGFAAKNAIDALRQRNVATASVMRAAGISERDLAESDPLHHRMSAAGQSRLLDGAAEAIEDAAFGLHLAEQSNPRDAGIIFYVMSAAENLCEALALLDRYSRIANEAVRMKLTATPEGLVVETVFVGLPRPLGRHGAEFLMAMTVRALRELAGRNIRPTRAAFAHARNSNMPEFARFFGCPVEFGRAADEGVASDLLEFSNAAVATPLLTADRKLLKALEPFCDMAAKERRTASDALRAAVEKEAEKLLPHGKAEKQTVARALGMSVRTFARRLAVEGTTYEDVVDELRRSLALQYLKDPGMSLSQIAWLLGYEGSTSFNHAFKRWTGHSPSVARKGMPLLLHKP
jgi:AraC-like DNA-binding protein